ncbi:MAG: hypothetical protein ACRD8Z_19245, partial [Nitrososphaeraceae archaeon]
MKGLSTKITLLVLLAAVLSMAVSATSNGLVFVTTANASTEGGDGEGGEGEGTEGDGGNENGDSDSCDGGEESESEPEPKPEPEPVETIPTPVPSMEQPNSEDLERESVTCPDGSVVTGIDCPEPFDPSKERTKTCPDGRIIDAVMECSLPQPAPALPTPVQPTPETTPEQPITEEDEPLPYCDQVEDDPSYTGSCHDRYDWDDNTGLY